jgi:hypothetical protein
VLALGARLAGILGDNLYLFAVAVLCGTVVIHAAWQRWLARDSRRRASLKSWIIGLRDQYHRDAESFADEPSFAVGWITEIDDLVRNALTAPEMARLRECTTRDQRYSFLCDLLDRIDRLEITRTWKP